MQNTIQNTASKTSFSNLSAQELQSIASNPQNNVCVSASAGSGKTKVLIDRFLRLSLISHPQDILCITYTNATAQEMLDRINLALEKWQTLENSQLYKALYELTGIEPKEKEIQRARELYTIFTTSNLKIQTIHAFCQSILSKYYKEEQLCQPPEITENYDNVISEALNIAMEQMDLAKLWQHYDTFSVQRLAKDILQNKNMFHGIESLEDYARWLDDIFTLQKIDISELHRYKNIPITDVKLQKFFNIPNTLQEFHQFKSCFLRKDGQPRAIPKYIQSHGMYETISEIQNIVYGINNNIINHEIADFNRVSVQFAMLFLAAYIQVKQRHNLADYDDILHNSLKLLQNEHLLVQLKMNFNHILIDEAQDLSALQWNIVHSMLANFFTDETHQTIFIVGDYKQSIYSFQGASPDVFLRTKEYYQEALQNQNWHNIELNTSFRSTKDVLHCVDNVFAQIGMPLTHIAFRSGSGGAFAFPLCEKSTPQEQSFIPQPSSGQEVSIIAKQIGSTIASWINNKRLLKAKNRPIQPNDIMILLRKRSTLQAELASVLRGLGIPVSGQDKVNLSSNLLVLDMLALLRFCLFSEDESNLFCLLKSPIFALSNNALHQLCYQRKQNIIDVLKTQHPKVADRLMEYQKYFQANSAWHLFIKVLYHDGAKLAYSDDSEQILQQFLDMARINSPFELISRITDNIITLEPNQNAVRIMSVHNSKGLQAPVVILADAASSEQLPYDKVFQYEHFPFFAKTSAHGISPVVQSIHKKHIAEASQENRRLMYVAMTRAEDELYVAGTINNKVEKSWYNLIAPHCIECKFIEVTQQQNYSAKHEPEVNYTQPMIVKKQQDQLVTSNASDVSYSPEGTEIHLALEGIACLGDSDAQPNIDDVQQYLADFELSEETIQQLAHTILQHGNILFHGVSEFPMVAKLNGKIFSLRIDKVLFHPNMQAPSTVDIIEYKSDRVKNSNAYKKQLAIYQAAMRKQFPDAEINCFILWVRHSVLETIV